MISTLSRLVGRHSIATFAIASLLSASAGSRSASASDLDVIVGSTVTTGVDCKSPLTQTFPRVWLGHFSGGYSHYTGPGGTILLDWRDEKLCFPTRRSCDRWVQGLRSDYHHPEGYFTCLTIR